VTGEKLQRSLRLGSRDTAHEPGDVMLFAVTRRHKKAQPSRKAAASRPYFPTQKREKIASRIDSLTSIPCSSPVVR
jgi:hypothetical protein